MPRPISRRQLVLAAAAAPLACNVAEPPASRRSAGSASPSRARDVVAIVDAQPTTDGAGVKLRRALGGRALPMLDPFLLLDEIHSDRAEDYARGFPTHPHRGFETVTYMIDGAMEHRDSLGNHGHLGPGSAQWMTAGRGIVHSEMPTQENGRMWGFQLWVNLPASLKMTTPRYQDIAPERVTELEVDDAHVRLVAGEAHGARGPVDGIVTAPAMLDVAVPPKGRARLALPPEHNAFLYVVQGACTLGDARTKASSGQVAVLGRGDVVDARSDGGARFLLFAARPIGEPVARSGPFVMNTDEELRKAWDDYRAGRLVDG